jgi:prophage DNA circulation protein
MTIVDSVVNSIIDAWNGGPANWRDRLAEQITLTSPEGNEFTGKWRGSPRTMAKKLGVLRHPKIKGDIVQDLDVASILYTITFWFEGENNDTEAAAFVQACKENGTWTIIHPVHGFLVLQLVTVTELANPVESGNITEINSEWIEPIDPLELKTGRELAGIVDARADDLNITAAQQFADNILAASEGLRGAIESTTDGIERVTDLFLSPLFTTVDAIDNAVDAIQRGITDTHNATIFRAEQLAGQIQNLINLPLFSNNQLDGRVAAYNAVIAGLSDQLPGQTEAILPATSSDEATINSISTIELALAAAIGAMARSVVTSAVSPRGLGADDTGALQTKSQAIKAVVDLSAAFDDMTNNLDAAMDAFSTNDIDKQYYSQSQSYNDAALLIYLAIEYLLSTAFELSIERRFVLQKPRAPIEITITEYGELGEGDSLLDLFIRSNNLQGQDILLLPAGREVVIYA